MPVWAVLATAEPEIVPVSALAITATRPGPPVIRPATTCARSTIASPAPERSRNAPNRMNITTIEALIPAMLPKMPSSP